MPGTRKLGKTTSQRMAMLRQQVTDFLDLGRMETTVTRAKEIAPLAEKMISLGKAKDLNAYRQALSFITREDVAKKVFDEIAPNWSDSFNLNKKAVSEKWIQLFFSLSAKLFELRRQKDCASFMPRFARHSLREKYFCRGTRPRQKCI